MAPTEIATSHIPCGLCPPTEKGAGIFNIFKPKDVAQETDGSRFWQTLPGQRLGHLVATDTGRQHRDY